MRRTRHGLLLPREVDGWPTAPAEAHNWTDQPLHIPSGWHLDYEGPNPRGKPRFTRSWSYRPMAGGDHTSYRTVHQPAGKQLLADAPQVTGTAEVLMWPADLTQIFANDGQVTPGQYIFVTAGGIASTPASAATTMTINPRFGTSTSGTTLGISNTSPTTPASQTNVPWYLEWFMCVRDINSAAATAASTMSVMGFGTFSSIIAGTTTAPGTLVMGGTPFTTADSTSLGGIVFGVILGGSASWTLTTRSVVIEYAN